jgi:hypothetical protein
MRIHSFIYTALLLVLVVFQSCSKSVTNGNNGNHDTIITTNPASKYIVDTYAGKILNSISQPGPLCVDDLGVLYVSETNHNVIMKVDPLVQSVGVFSGSFNQPGCMDDLFGSGNPSLVFPQTLWFSSDKLIFIGDYECAAKAATTTGKSAAIQYDNPNYISVSPSGACKDYKGNIYLFDSFAGLYEIPAANPIIVQVVKFSDLGIASSITMDAADKNIYLAAKHQILQYADGTLSTIAGDSVGNQDGQGQKAKFGGSMAICLGGDGNIYVADTNNNSVRQVSPNGSVVTIAGDGKEGYAEGSGDKAEFYNPSGIAYASVAGKNVLYVSDFGNNVIRRITLPN